MGWQKNAKRVYWLQITLHPLFSGWSISYKFLIILDSESFTFLRYALCVKLGL